MKITKIEQAKKNKERVNIYADGEYAFSLYIDTVLEYSLKEGDEIDENVIKQAAKEDEKRYAVKTALKYVSYKMRSSGEVRKKLKQKEISDSAISYALEKMSEYGYINDDEYAKMFVEEFKDKKGRIDIEERLLGKGISKELARKYLKNIDQSDTVLEQAQALKERYKNDDEYKAKQKMFRTLMMRGFDFEQIKKAVAKVYSGDNWYDD